MLWQGVNPRWISRFLFGRHVLDDGVTTDEEWWEYKDQVSMGDAYIVHAELTEDERINKRLTELGY